MEFPGAQSKTVIVGPNGSGKSNIADAVKWVLGEQSLKLIRGKKAEDVIFSGSDKKARLGMAQVSLYLNNEDKPAPIDYSQLVITRRVYRDGQSEYLINKNQVRLFDILMLLARANFGQRSHGIIGQGQIDAVIMATPTERKDFFDEAVGIRKFQIKKNQAINKLERSEENLNQARGLIKEIEPGLKSLTRQVKKLEQRDKIKTELTRHQQVYYSQIWRDLDEKIKADQDQQAKIDARKTKVIKELDQIKNQLDQIEKEKSRTKLFSDLQTEYNQLISQKNDLLRQQTIIKGRLELEFEKQGKLNLAWLYRKEEELKMKLEEWRKEAKEITDQLENLKNKLTDSQREEQKLTDKISHFEKKLTELKNKIKLDLTKEPLNDIAKEILAIHDQQEKLIKKIAKITPDTLAKETDFIDQLKKEAENVNKKLKDLTSQIKEQTSAIDLEEKIKTSETSAIWQIQEDLNQALRQKEELARKINDLKIDLKVLDNKKELTDRELAGLSADRTKAEAEIKQLSAVGGSASGGKTAKGDLKKFDQENQAIRDKIEKIDTQIKAIENKLNQFNQTEEKKKEQLFRLERQYQNVQHEMNQYYKSLNDIKVELARLETKKEDLEKEIRQEMGDLKHLIRDLRELPPDSREVKSDQLFSRIEKLKYQLELIGGIDPETMTEYQETKERHDFLTTQAADLEQAIDSLEKVIKELDDKIHQQFDSAFAKINKQFEKYFRILFGGGKAKLTKIIEEPPRQEPGYSLADQELGQSAGETEQPEPVVQEQSISRARKYQKTAYKGIEIYASPPGKKLKGVSMLSGGERSLTALALISAIIASNPSPFVFLDEVDAALDEANSQRMARIIEDLSDKTQFIIITHNRAIMNIADVIYGVTMGSDGVSKLLSVKLEEADKHATRL